MCAESDATQLAVAAGRNPHRPAATPSTATRRSPLPPKRPTCRSRLRSPLDWVKLESRAEARNLHVTAAHGCRPPKRPVPHAAYRRDQVTTEAISQSSAPEGEPRAPVRRAAEAPLPTRTAVPPAAEATGLPASPCLPKQAGRHNPSFQRRSAETRGSGQGPTMRP